MHVNLPLHKVISTRRRQTPGHCHGYTAVGPPPALPENRGRPTPSIARIVINRHA
ncbi:hypothetical protein ACCUM_3089 [Candidatus Accumulibacter phosphatis]|uniref:Uncharacterized protein n=1 Tax=Candidatus Accumulibacter phosphatis TaxID=327160 RepID=A0A5S4EQA8_9PROT|nr:hypothetical protein ACCUM_3089 [Candidatus Accumulibacter phosphatis]